ncbi:preprotein translocase subunit SecE [Tsukamurella sp. 1534]|uniref:preprotein translocase subunit SecE n=1 Tax=Tsukamurella sp. 1534 TaxID=1151061 RepID=UPI0002DC84B3|nr:preprotein translocase subunit SecE [Tsukamurella sp. 1534]
MSDEHDDATTGNAGDSAAEDGAQQARPSGKRGSGRRGRTALAEPSESATSAESSAPARGAATKKQSRNPFAAIWLFLRQVVAELRKVIWPTRNQMVNYTIIVLVFVVVLTAFVSLLDLGFAKLMLWAFS